ncbi:MAG: glycosidase, partial [Oscillospiraceae bacterium]
MKSKTKILGEKIPNIPWQDKPDNCEDVVWRHTMNPIIDRSYIKNSNSIFNSAIVTFNGEFRGVFRSDSTTRQQLLHS